MKVLIVYYSQSGNTRKIARAIHKGASQLAEKCEIAPVKRIAPQDLDRYDLIGLGSPVWMGGETPNIRRFVEGLPDQKGKHIFSFNTHGTLPELYFPGVVRRLKARGFTVIGMRDWYGGYIQSPTPYYTDGHPDEIDLKEAEDFGREIVETSRRISAGEVELIPPVPEHVLTPQLLVLLDFYQAGHNPHAAPLTYNREKCLYPKCTLCMDNCPMNYIDLSADPPIFGSEKTKCDNWVGCTFCEMICPTGAIDGHWEEFLKSTESSTRILDYNLLERAAYEAEAAGRLRILVPKEEIRWDKDPMDFYKKHPRFKITEQD